jgi:hypothetical protein
MIIVKWIVKKLFPLQICVCLILICLSQTTSAQSVDSLIQIYPGIGDTLTSFNRNYLGLFPEVEDFDYAMFFIRDNDKLVTKIYSSNQVSSTGAILIQNLTVKDSFYSIIEKSDLDNTKLISSSWWDAKIKTKEENIIEGELIMFDCNYLYLTAENIRADHIGKMTYRIPVSEIKEIFQEENSNRFLGICIGGSLGTFLGFGVAKSIGDFEALKYWFALAFIGTAIGGIIGHATSTKGEMIYFESDMDVLKLKGRIAYIIDKGLLKKQKYYDIQMQKDN